MMKIQIRLLFIYVMLFASLTQKCNGKQDEFVQEITDHLKKSPFFRNIPLEAS